jgi:hypothetical protein
MVRFDLAQSVYGCIPVEAHRDGRVQLAHDEAGQALGQLASPLVVQS